MKKITFGFCVLLSLGVLLLPNTTSAQVGKIVQKGGKAAMKLFSKKPTPIIKNIPANSLTPTLHHTTYPSVPASAGYMATKTVLAKCYSCNGYGRVRCHFCSGNGGGNVQVWTPYGLQRQWQTCPSCRGSGFFTCTSCGGSGR